MYGGIIIPREEEIHPITITEDITNTYYVYGEGGDIYNVYVGIFIPRDEEISRLDIINFA